MRGEDIAEFIASTAEATASRIMKQFDQRFVEHKEEIKKLIAQVNQGNKSGPPKCAAPQLPSQLLQELEKPVKEILNQRPSFSNWAHAKPEIPDKKHPPTVVNETISRLLLAQNTELRADDARKAYHALDAICKAEVQDLAAGYHCEDRMLPMYSKLPNQLLHDISVIVCAKAIHKDPNLSLLWHCEEYWPFRMVFQTKWTQKVPHAKQEYDKALKKLAEVIIL
ncbi:hypothetical protein MBANPS3_003768, partial [Mucor bainieri]